MICLIMEENSSSAHCHPKCYNPRNNNNCGQIEGIAWSPDSIHIVTAHGRGDEGVFYWYADLDEDNDGYNTTDQGDGVVDAFPSEGTQWDDTDNDGYGDNPAPAFQPDACVIDPGTSTQDRFGCPDGDGDGWSDEGDVYPTDPLQWADTDGDGVVDGMDQCLWTDDVSTVDSDGCSWFQRDDDGALHAGGGGARRPRAQLRARARRWRAARAAAAPAAASK